MTALTTDIDRDTLRDRYRAVRDRTEALAAPLTSEDQVVQSMPDVSPTKWHRAHTTWFFETFLLSPSLPHYRVFDPAYGYLFNSYYEAVGPRHPRPHRGLLSRPSVDDIACYRRHVDNGMYDLINHIDGHAAELVELGVNHEEQHQELLLMDIKHVLSCNPIDPAYEFALSRAHDPSPLEYVEIEGGVVELGDAGDGFAFDNERPRHLEHLEAYRFANRLVNAGEWLEFIHDGGYERPEFWLSDGWYAVQEHGWSAPLYWCHDDTDGWSIFTLNGRRPLDVNEPVIHVSHYEADAYARWAGARLATEFEWEHAATSTRPGRFRQLDDVAWQWTASAYLPYPRFHPAAGAVGEYNGKFMSGQMVLRGGASITPAGHTRVTYRNFFPPASRWMFGGVRLAMDAT
jgi:ergothioneine biosynthesis protein EgtB